MPEPTNIKKIKHQEGEEKEPVYPSFPGTKNPPKNTGGSKSRRRASRRSSAKGTRRRESRRRESRRRASRKNRKTLRRK
jgi:hypothetical protein